MLITCVQPPHVLYWQLHASRRAVLFEQIAAADLYVYSCGYTLYQIINQPNGLLRTEWSAGGCKTIRGWIHWSEKDFMHAIINRVWRFSKTWTNEIVCISCSGWTSVYLYLYASPGRSEELRSLLRLGSCELVKGVSEHCEIWPMQQCHTPISSTVSVYLTTQSSKSVELPSNNYVGLVGHWPVHNNKHSIYMYITIVQTSQTESSILPNHLRIPSGRSDIRVGMDRVINSVDVGGSVQDFVYKMCFHVFVCIWAGLIGCWS